MSLSPKASIDSESCHLGNGARFRKPGFESDRASAEFELTAKRVGLIGQSRVHLNLLCDLGRAAQYDAEVFLVGETGVGKELYARYVHECSPRSKGEFVAVNCGVIPDSLFENEMFGHSAGAYTDAKSRCDGLVAAADGGTLFLDEIDGLPKSGQVKLLRLLQQKEYRRLGDPRVRRADIRVISAMNRDPLKAIADGDLRQDLYYRLSVCPTEIAPLRQRSEDIALLLEHFVRQYCTENDGLEFTSSAKKLLCAFHWPGNVRQLENVVRSIVCQLPRNNTTVGIDDLPIGLPPESASGYVSEHLRGLLCLSFGEAKRRTVERFEIDYLCEMLRRTNGNINQAAKLARKNRRAFFELMRKHGVDADEFRSG